MTEYTVTEGEKIWSIPTRPLFPLLPQGLEGILPVFIEDREVGQWIESQLEKDADWFMPHPIWVELGFKKRRGNLSVSSVDHVSPPVFHETKSPEFLQEYGIFDSLFRFMVQQNDEKTISALCFWIMKDFKWKNADFYKNWRIIRREHKEKIDENPKLMDVARILDRALIEYIMANHNPNVNLQTAFNDYLCFKDAEKIVSGIRDGKYRFR